MTEPHLSPTTTVILNTDDDGLAKLLGDLDKIENVGVLLLIPQVDSQQEAVERGILVSLVRDASPGICGGMDETDTEHIQKYHTPLATGRITYAKAMQTAMTLLSFCSNVGPLDSTEEALVERLSGKLRDFRQAQQEQAQYDTEAKQAGLGGYSVI